MPRQLVARPYDHPAGLRYAEVQVRVLLWRPRNRIKAGNRQRERERDREIEGEREGKRTARTRDRERRWKQDGMERAGLFEREEDGLRQPDMCSIPVLLDGEDGSHCPRVRKVPVGSISPPGLLLLRQLNLLDVAFYRKHDFHGFQDYRRNLTRTPACLDIPVGALAYLATYPPTCAYARASYRMSTGALSSEPYGRWLRRYSGLIVRGYTTQQRCSFTARTVVLPNRLVGLYLNVRGSEGLDVQHSK